MPSYAERRKQLDAVYAKIGVLATTPENEKKNRDKILELNRHLNILLELPKWWESTLFFHEEHKKNTSFVYLNEFKAPTTPYIKVIVKWTNQKHIGRCYGNFILLPVTRHILAAALPLTQPDGSQWDFEKHDEFVPRWQECGDYCGSCMLIDKIELLHWKVITPTTQQNSPLAL
jgi:hypothetical protein